MEQPSAELSFLTNLTQLVSLDLGHNRITNLASLKGLTNLKNLSLRRNRLSSIDTLESLPHLANVDVGLNLLDLTATGKPWEVIQGLLLNGVNVAYLPTNEAPQFAAFWSDERPLIFSPGPTWFIPANTNSSLDAYVWEGQWPDDSELVVTATSSNPSVVSIQTNVLPGTNFSRTVTVGAGDSANQHATITLTVTDDVLLSSSTNIEVVLLPNARILDLCTNVDPNLADAVAFWSDKAAGDLTPTDLLLMKSLVIENASFGDMCFWQWLTNLSALSLSAISISNPGLLMHLGQLTSLALSNTVISDPAPLRSLGHLTNLSLYGETIGDLTYLTNLTPLTSLAISNNQATSYSFLAGLTNLIELSLSGESIVDVGFLTNLIALNTLTLFKTRVSDLSPLAGLTNLQFLHLQQNRLTNLWALKDLPQLIYADVRLNLIDTRTNSFGRLSIEELTSRGVMVSNEPQRELMISAVNTNWLIAGETPSWLYFGVSDNGVAADVAISTKASDAELFPEEDVVSGQIADRHGTNWFFRVISAMPTNLADSAVITVTVTNEVGLRADTAITVTVVKPQDVGSVFVDPYLTGWTNLDAAPWFGQTTVTHLGAPAAQTGSRTSEGDAWLGADVTGPGQLSFWWKVSCERMYFVTNYSDFLTFYISSNEQARISGEVDWQQQVYHVPAGSTKLWWGYFKDLDSSCGMDAGWVAQVGFVPGSWLQLGDSPTNGQCHLALNLESGRLYEVLASTNLANWFRLALVAGTNSTIPLTDRSATNGVQFYRLRDVSVWLERPRRAVDGSVRFLVQSSAGLVLEIQGSTNMTSWSPLATITNSLGALRYTDALATNSSVRFYRAQVVP